MKTCIFALADFFDKEGGVSERYKKIQIRRNDVIEANLYVKTSGGVFCKFDNPIIYVAMIF